MHSVRSIPAVVYQVADSNLGMLTELYIPTYKVGLTVFGEVFASEKTRYRTNFVFRFKDGPEWDIGKLPHNAAMVDGSVADRLVILSKKDRFDTADSAYIQRIMNLTFPEIVRPGPDAIAEFHELRLKEKFDPIKTPAKANPLPVAIEPVQKHNDLIELEPIQSSLIKPAAASIQEPAAVESKDPVKAQSKKSDDEEDDYVCPLTQVVMIDPWVDPEGNSFEKSAILEWLEKSQTSPITRTELKREQLAPNRALKKIIQKKYPHLEAK